jgi:hypothetical protein
MYLIYEAIADDVGGQHALDNLKFVPKSDLSAFRLKERTETKVSLACHTSSRMLTA